jgi:hypothetical protein
MSDRRRKIEALRAKADSTTFPAEAAALRAKADELAKQEPVADRRAQSGPINTPGGGFYARPTAANNVTIRFTGNLFEEMGGIRVTQSWATAADDAVANRVRVTDVNGRTYWIAVE